MFGLANVCGYKNTLSVYVQAVDLAIHKCNNAYIKLQEAEAAFQKSGMKDRPMGYPLRGSLWNPINWFKKGPSSLMLTFLERKCLQK